MNASTHIPPLEMTPIPAFRDNYIWALSRGLRVAVVDPGDAQPVLDWLRETGKTLTNILITHHHSDHTGGIARLLDHVRVPVFGPVNPGIQGISHRVGEGARVGLTALNLTLDVWAVPGHTLDHIAYVGVNADPEPFVLCGDTLFAAGCGRLFEGTPAQMHQSLRRLAALPGQTRVYCTHEYTLANLRFAAAVDSHNAALRERALAAAALRERGMPTLPSTIELECATNPFLRCHDAAVQHAVSEHAGRILASPTEVFAELREWKNRF